MNCCGTHSGLSLDKLNYEVNVLRGDRKGRLSCIVLKIIAALVRGILVKPCLTRCI